MRREVVQDFLNLPGIVGFALIDGRSRPYFWGVEQTLNFQQREALARGIQQVIDSTPASFEFFEFQFSGHQVYIYKLEQGIILLVLMGRRPDAAYTATIERLKQELRTDVAGAIATFRLLAGVPTLSGQTQWRPTAGPAAVAGPALPSPAPAKLPIGIGELLAAMNHLSQFTTRYLGVTMVVNYWKSTRPQGEWLGQFQVDRAARISFTGPAARLTADHQRWIQAWVAAFIDRCTKVIRDFPRLVEQNALDDHQKSLLFPDSP